jgi:hypothetical protein
MRCEIVERRTVFGHCISEFFLFPFPFVCMITASLLCYRALFSSRRGCHHTWAAFCFFTLMGMILCSGGRRKRVVEKGWLGGRELSVSNPTGIFLFSLGVASRGSIYPR